MEEFKVKFGVQKKSLWVLDKSLELFLKKVTNPVNQNLNHWWFPAKNLIFFFRRVGITYLVYFTTLGVTQQRK